MSITKKYQSTKNNFKVVFSHPATEGVSTVQLLGDFNNWDAANAPKLKKSKNEFTHTIELPAGSAYEFKYLVDGTRWENDHNADKYVVSPFGTENSVVVLEATAAPVKKVAAKTAKTTTPKGEKAPVAKAVKVSEAKVEKKAKPATKKTATAAVKTEVKAEAKKAVKKTTTKTAATKK